MQDFTNYTPNPQGAGSVTQAGLGSEALFFQRIYTWMFAGLGLTAVAAVVFAAMGVPQMLAGSTILRWGSFLGLLGLVWYLSANVHEMAPSTAKILFLVYAAAMGIILSIVVAFYKPEIIFKAFVSTCGVYGAMALYGLVTKRSLEGLGTFLYMGLVGLFIAIVVNWIVGSERLDYIICIVGVLIFAGLTAFDHQKLRVMYYTAEQQGITEDNLARVVIMGALDLYLDFINLFLFLLRILNRE